MVVNCPTISTAFWKRKTSAIEGDATHKHHPINNIEKQPTINNNGHISSTSTQHPTSFTRSTKIQIDQNNKHPKIPLRPNHQPPTLPPPLPHLPPQPPLHLHLHLLAPGPLRQIRRHGRSRHGRRWNCYWVGGEWRGVCDCADGDFGGCGCRVVVGGGEVWVEVGEDEGGW